MKLEFINNGNEFELPKKTIVIEDEIETLDYMAKQCKDMDVLAKRLTEICYIIYVVLRKIDKNITFETIKNNLSMEEAGALNLLFRTKGNLSYSCPHCNKEFLYMELMKKENQENNDNGGSDKSLPRLQKPDTMKTKKTS